jgi:hypothetical protein
MESLPHASIGDLLGNSEGSVKDAIIAGNRMSTHLGGQAFQFGVVLLLEFFDEIGTTANGCQAKTECLGDE